MLGASAELYGLPIVTVRSDLIDAPANFKLSADVPVTREYRRDFDAWARRFFGPPHTYMQFTDPATGRTQVLMSEEGLAELRRQAVPGVEL